MLTQSTIHGLAPILVDVCRLNESLENFFAPTSKNPSHWDKLYL